MVETQCLASFTTRIQIIETHGIASLTIICISPRQRPINPHLSNLQTHKHITHHYYFIVCTTLLNKTNTKKSLTQNLSFLVIGAVLEKETRRI
jgi:hypothetical protein